ncbi:hypothetical protein D2E25_1023 [Bifidobacterium goeldii]|uniref:Transmembrane protein n=2 Tax=Bifidobacterium goeldii TaxID=2306975 RepID=A0A430FJS3_9BIFI|nr:hypothetical protein D2E25_1023 [Bifidobacterium goeldii]
MNDEGASVRGSAYVLTPPAVIHGTHEEAARSLRADRISTFFGAIFGVVGVLVVLCIGITAISGIDYAIGHMWVSEHGDAAYFSPSWATIFGLVFSVLIALACVWAVFSICAAAFKNRARSRRISQFRRNPNVLAVRGDQLLPNVQPVFVPDREDVDDDIDSHPIKRILFRDDGTLRQRRIPAYVPQSLWEQAVGWATHENARYLMAWLDVTINGDTLSVTAVKPIDPVTVERAFKRHAGQSTELDAQLDDDDVRDSEEWLVGALAGM